MPVPELDEEQKMHSKVRVLVVVVVLWFVVEECEDEMGRAAARSRRSARSHSTRRSLFSFPARSHTLRTLGPVNTGRPGLDRREAAACCRPWCQVCKLGNEQSDDHGGGGGVLAVNAPEFRRVVGGGAL